MNDVPVAVPTMTPSGIPRTERPRHGVGRRLPGHLSARRAERLAEIVAGTDGALLSMRIVAVFVVSRALRRLSTRTAASSTFGTEKDGCRVAVFAPELSSRSYR